MKMRRRTFRIGELAKKLLLERFVIRFWEKEFKLKTDRSQGGQRFYTEDDYTLFQLIKDLLYNRGFTIHGAKREINQLKKITPDKEIIGSKKTTFNEVNKDLIDSLKKEKALLEQKVLILQQQLLKLRELL
jgi:DNA-binding transcriptional MerR regulator